jgi:hypothetical protein
MRKRDTISLAVLATLLLGAAVCPASDPPEPIYEGKSLSAWLKEIEPESTLAWGSFPMDPLKGPSSRPTIRLFGTYGRLVDLSGHRSLTATQRQAIEQAGTNAIPTLLRLLRIKGLNRAVAAPDDVVNSRAKEGFQVLGSAASNAVPALIAIFKENISDSSRLGALDALGWIGTAASEAVPVVLRTTESRYVTERKTALWSLGMIHAQPDLVISNLFKLTQDPDDSVRVQAWYGLSAYGPEANLGALQLQAELVVPALSQGLIDYNDEVRREAANAMAKFGSKAKSAVPSLVQALSATNSPSVKAALSKALLQIDPEAAAKAGITNAP